MKLINLKTLSALGLALMLSNNAHAALVAVNLGGGTNNGVYDDVLDITWLANANLAASNTFGVTGINSSGSMTWNTAESYIDAMNAANSGAGYLGVNTWRQSTSSTCTGFNCNSSVSPVDELGYHHYTNFDASARGSILSGSNTVNLALFSNIQSAIYWTGTEVASSAFFFRTNVGFKSILDKNKGGIVWAVAPGNVAAVPVPAAVWLMGSALVGLAGFGRKRQR